jgi:hypothetical protein
MVNAIPIVGWALSFAVNVSLAIPFWICWTICGIGSTYFKFLPQEWQSIPFWNCVGLFISISILKLIVVPRLASVSQSSGKDD